MTIEDAPQVMGDVGEIHERDVKKVVDFVKANRAALVDLWNEDVSAWGIDFEKLV